jgi:hypothetical protein
MHAGPGFSLIQPGFTIAAFLSLLYLANGLLRYWRLVVMTIQTGPVDRLDRFEHLG